MRFEDFPLMKLGHEIQLVGTVWQGDGNVYLAMLPGEELSFESGCGCAVVAATKDGYNAGYELQLTPGEWEKFIAQTDQMETEIIAKSADGKLTKTIVRKSQRQIDQVLSWRVFKRDGYACRYCGNADVPLTVDHLVLWEDGGPTTEANLASACRKCNKTRGRTQYAEWLRSDYYRRVSKNLTEAQRQANAELVATLDAIPRVHNVRSR